MICLVEMPFSSLTNPPVGVHLLSALLKNAGLDVKILYLNADFAKLAGYESYLNLSQRAGYMSEWLEWLFAGIAWNWNEERENEALEAISRGVGADNRLSQWARGVRRDIVPVFVERCLEKIESVPNCRTVGFSCMFNLLPSLALGRLVREALPDVRLVYGGAVFYGEIGMEIFDKVEWIDAISTSEADDVTAEVFRRLSDGEPLNGLRGMAHRDRATGKIYKTPGSGVPLDVFDNDVAPDFGDYFESVREHGGERFFSDNPHKVFLPFESSRGCWWHDKHPCTFCGMNGNYAYRLKSPENVVSVLKNYRKKYGVTSFFATDSILPMEYFDSFFPLMKNAFPEGVKLYYELKSNLNRDKIKTLAEAGMRRMQAGIESLSDHVLELMSKGVSAIQNVFFLKCARQYVIHPYWLLLLGTIGETAEDCREIAELIPKLLHLAPPREDRAFVQVHRYSEYWRNSERYFDEIKPTVKYEALFPDFFDRLKLAHNFDAKWKLPPGEPHNTEELNEARETLLKALLEWKRRWEMKEKPTLRVSEGGATIFDTRGEMAVTIVLDPKEAEIYAMLDDITPKRTVLEKISLCSPKEAERILNDFATHGLAMRSITNSNTAASRIWNPEIPGPGDELYLGLALSENHKFWDVSGSEKESVLGGIMDA